MYRIPVTVILRNGEQIYTALTFERKPTEEQVRKEAVKLGQIRQAREVHIPDAWL